MKKLLLLLNIAAALFLISWIGIKYDLERDERMAMIKHRPSLDFIFYSPIGTSDKILEDLEPAQQQQELLYRAYVTNPKHQMIDNLALVFFQVSIYLIVVSVLQLLFFRRKYRIKIGRAVTINALALVILLGMSQIFWTKDLSYTAIISLQIVLNILFIFPFLRKNK